MRNAEEWLDELSEELKGIYTEGIFNARWTVIETYHKIGKKLLTDENWVKFAKGNQSSLSQVTEKSGIKERELYRAVQFYDKYPDLDLLPDGKNISWHKIVNNLLPDTTKNDNKERHIITCPSCGFTWEQGIKNDKKSP